MGSNQSYYNILSMISSFQHKIIRYGKKLGKKNKMVEITYESDQVLDFTEKYKGKLQWPLCIPSIASSKC